MPCTNAQHYFSDYEQGLSQLSWACQCLDLAIAPAQLERWSELLVASLSGPGRYFHGPEHSLNLAYRVTQAPEYRQDGIAILAALFHDTVYVGVDGGLQPQVAAMLQTLIDWQGDTFCLRSPPGKGMGKGIGKATHASSTREGMAGEIAGNTVALGLRVADSGTSWIAELVTFLFGLSDPCASSPSLNATIALEATTHNEYLSALWATQLLAPALTPGQVAEVAVAIEATIPFREQAGCESDRRYQRLIQANARFQLGLSDAEMQRAIHRSVHLANCDLENFAAEDPVFFLDQTWLLLPEFNPALREPYRYRPADYRQALQKMETFMARLDTRQIFQQFHGTPTPALHQAWSQRAQYNLNVARLYLTTKVVAIGLIEALSHGQRPLSQYLGQPTHPHSSSIWEQYFPVLRLRRPLRSTLEFEVLQVAEEGRLTPCAFDSLRSPLAAFLIRSIGFKRIHQLRGRMQLFFDHKVNAETLLRGCEVKVVQATSQLLQPPS